MVEEAAFPAILDPCKRCLALEDRRERTRGIGEGADWPPVSSPACGQHHPQIRLHARCHGGDEARRVEFGLGLPRRIGDATDHHATSRRPDVRERVAISIPFDDGDVPSLLPQCHRQPPAPLACAANNRMALPPRDPPKVEVACQSKHHTLHHREGEGRGGKESSDLQGPVTGIEIVRIGLGVGEINLESEEPNDKIDRVGPRPWLLIRSLVQPQSRKAEHKRDAREAADDRPLVLSQPVQRSCMPVGHGVTMLCRIRGPSFLWYIIQLSGVTCASPDNTSRVPFTPRPSWIY